MTEEDVTQNMKERIVQMQQGQARYQQVHKEVL